MSARVKPPEGVADGHGGTKYTCRTKDEALAVMRLAKSRAHFRVHACMDAELPDTPDKYLPRAFSGSIHVSRCAAEMFVSDVFHEALVARGCALTIRLSAGHRRKKWDDAKRDFVEYGVPSMYVYIG